MDFLFNGFTKEALDFLFALRFCNTVEKQSENLEKYKKYITEPVNLLYLDLLKVTEVFDIEFETKPARCIASPFTDRRFSPSVPLKEYTYLRFRKAGAKADKIGLYFDMGSEAYGYGFKIYKPTASGMDSFRKIICGEQKRFSELTAELLEKGFDITGERYKKDNYPGLPESPAKRLLNTKCFGISKTKPIGENVFGEALAQELFEAFLDLKEFTELLGK